MTLTETLMVPGAVTPDLADLLHRPAWMADGLCAEYDLELWFPERGESVEPAKQVCARCAVAAECLEYALGQGSALHGIWGGTSAIERRRLRRRAAA